MPVIDIIRRAAVAVVPRWITPLVSNSVSSTDATSIAGTVMLAHVEVEAACTVDAIVFQKGTGVVSGNVRVGIYGPVARTTDTCLGAAVLSESASTVVSGATSNPQIVTLAADTPLTPGKYYIALQFDDAVVGKYLRGTNAQQVVGIFQTYARAGGYGAFTTPCPAVTDSGSNVPGFRLRVKSQP